VCGALALAALLFALAGPGVTAAAGLVVALLVVAKHHENLARLLRGDERRLGSRTT
jgi:glycerol-3-phosphate acyltransferase PlsY